MDEYDETDSTHSVLGIHRQITSLLGLMESWVSKLCAAIGQPEMMSISDWLKLEEALHTWQSLVEKVFQIFSCMQTEYFKDKNRPDT